MPLRIANFMDSSLEALDRKGNLAHALALYNPLEAAEKVVHFTPFPDDIRYAAMFAEHRIEVFPFFDGRTGIAKKLSQVPGALFRVVRKIRAERLNIVRGRLPYFSSLIGCVAARLLGLPSVVSLGGDNRIPQERERRYYFGSRRVSYAVEEAVMRLCSVIVVPNVYTREYVARLLGWRSSEKTIVIPWILDSAREGHTRAVDPSMLRALGISPDLPLILLVGHLNEYKYSRQMFQVADRFLRTWAGRAQVMFCGDGPLRAEGEQRLSGRPGVRFVGWQANSTVLGLVSLAAVVLVPMSGFVLLEAASCGAPVIASSIEWHSEMVVDGDSGWLVNPEAIDGWVDRIAWILDHPGDARAAGARLKAKFEEFYAPDVALRREVELYQRLTDAVRPT